MNVVRWNHFQLPHTLLSDDYIYELIVCVDEKEDYYFFGNALLWCLGYSKPHISMQTLVPPGERYKKALDNGIYLKESTVERLIADKVHQDPDYEPFQTWFKSYLSICKGSNPSSNCPLGP